MELAIGNYQRGLLTGTNPKSATLVKRRDGSYSIQIGVEHEPPKEQDTAVARAQVTHSFIALEDLTGIRERTNPQPRSKTERRRPNSWAFHQLRQFVHHKAMRAGVKVVLVPPAYSSQTCHKCLWIGRSLLRPSGQPTAG